MILCVANGALVTETEQCFYVAKPLATAHGAARTKAIILVTVLDIPIPLGCRRTLAAPSISADGRPAGSAAAVQAAGAQSHRPINGDMPATDPGRASRSSADSSSAETWRHARDPSGRQAGGCSSYAVHAEVKVRCL